MLALGMERLEEGIRATRGAFRGIWMSGELRRCWERLRSRGLR
jgi:hypothetical protein